MSVKTYLQEQIRLVSLSSYDLFTDEEYDLYTQIIEQKNELDKLDEKDPENTEQRKEILSKKKKLKAKLDYMIAQHWNTPRTVRLKSIIYYPKIIVKWKNIEILRQLLMNGFYVPMLINERIHMKHFRYFTASAGQLRRDKFMAISDDVWNKVHKRLECGLDWNAINERGGINSNKLSAYEALPNSATEEWIGFNIDRVIVVDDYVGDVTDRMTYIKPDYTWEKIVKTVQIKHTDGCGMMLPSESMSNFMIRMPYVKGLLISFDYIRFCKINNVPAVVTDIYGVEHDLIKEDIRIILFKSMFKLAKYYDNWDHYKREFKKNDCRCGKTNYEEEYLANKAINYQMIQTLTDFTDDEIKEFTKEEHKRIYGITKDMDSMLKTLKADEESEQPYKAALAVYPELLREAYSADSLKAIRKRMILDAKSGKIRLLNKRLFACPDLYGVCEWLFCHEEHPKGLLKNGEVACKIFRRHEVSP